jgi:hypothetical protein
LLYICMYYIRVSTTMTNSINLHTIFRYLTNNDSFLLSVEEVDPEERISNKKKHKVDLMTSIVTDHGTLSPYEIQEYSALHSKIKTFLNPKYSRLGIKNVTEKNLNIVNISFLNSLNLILRPELFRMNIDEQMKNVGLLENFVIHRISRNYQIDRIKNTSRAKAKNRDLITLFSQGKITSELIQYCVNIFEINLVIFDLTKTEILLYWSSGIKYPYFNLFRDIYFMTHINGNYEPLVPLDSVNESEDIHKLYTTILTRIDEIKTSSGIKLHIASLPYLESWNIPHTKYLKILKMFYNESTKTVDQCIEEFKNMIELKNETEEKEIED